MTVLMVQIVGLLGAALFVGVLLTGVCVVLAAIADLVRGPRRRAGLRVHPGDAPCATLSGPPAGRG